MSFQKCPVCSGSGYVFDGLIAVRCKVCNGTGIINEETGQPPIGNPVSTPNTGDFNINRETQR